MTVLSNIEDSRLKQGVKLKRLISTFRRWYPYEEITNMIWSMCDRSSNRLSEFVALENVSNSGNMTIASLHDAVLRGDETPTIRSTTAGKVFLESVYPHFEYFSQITEKNNEPLFSMSDVNNYGSEQFDFEQTIQNVIHCVNKCVSISNKHYDLLRKEPQAKEAFPLLRINKNGRNYEQHMIERIVSSHIRYLDCYRLFLMENKIVELAKKIEINRVLIHYISDYIGLLKNARSIESSFFIDNVIPRLESLIRYITRNGYTDFSTPIER